MNRRSFLKMLAAIPAAITAISAAPEKAFLTHDDPAPVNRVSITGASGFPETGDIVTFEGDPNQYIVQAAEELATKIELSIVKQMRGW